MEVDSGYFFKHTPEVEPIGIYQHQRLGRLTSINADELWQTAGASPKPGQSVYRPLIQCANSIDEARKVTLLH